MNDFFQHCPSTTHTENLSVGATPLLMTGKAGWAGTERRRQEEACTLSASLVAL